MHTMKNQNVSAKLYLWYMLNICHLYMMESHSSFLLNSYDDLLESMGLILRYFDSLSTSKYRDHFTLPRQFQKSIELLGLFLKNFLRSFNIAMEYNWYKWIVISKICLAAKIVSIMWLTSCKCVWWSWH